MARHRFLFYIYKTVFLSDRKALKILHFAPEEPFFRLMSGMSNIEYITGDIEPKQYPYATGCRPMNALDIPFPEQSFDVVLANHLIEHVDEEKFLLEVHRVLKAHGVALISTPVYPELEKTLEDAAIVTPQQRTLHYGHPEHLRKYGRDAAERFGKIFNVHYIAHDDIPPFGDTYNSNCFILTKKSG